MDVIFILLPLCLFMGGASLLAFVWAVRNGQFEDLSTPAWRMLFDAPLAQTLSPIPPESAKGPLTPREGSCDA